MMPIATSTQITIPTQPSMVATHMPNTTGVVHAAPNAVAPSVASDKITPDAKGNGVYTAPVSAATPATQLSAPLSVLVPASFTTNAASLSADAMFATQALAQDPSVYDQMVAASEVKYKPSNATAPEPAPNNLFAKMLAEEQSHTQQTARNVQQATTTAPTQAAQTQAPITKPNQSSARKTEQQPAANVRSIATSAYSATQGRNHIELGDVKVEEITESRP